MTEAANTAGLAIVASTQVDVLDLYRVPYDVVPADGDGTQSISSAGGPALRWPELASQPVRAKIGDISIFAPLATDEEVDALLARSGMAWEPCAVVHRPGGERNSSVRRASDGSIFLPFDPNRAVRMLLSEEYVGVVSGERARLAHSIARRMYYRLRPLVPRSLQIALRRRFASLQRRSTFPGWPTESALHDLHEWLLAVLQQVVGEPLPQLAWWPRGYRWAVVITHDVERARGYAMVEELAGLDSDAGLRSAWYFVPERDYEVDESLVGRLQSSGFEVGVHGLRHDGRDLLPGVFERRLPAMQSYAASWQATGFRSPSTQRSWELISRLGFDHDSSYSDIARFEPQGGGSCSWLPFFIGEVVELPITLPMDHTLFELLGERDGALWAEKAAFLRERGGLALLLTHPDYLAAADARDAYQNFLHQLSADTSAWHALPREVSDWWRRRSETKLRFDGDRWLVEGPAAHDARVVLRDRSSALVLPRDVGSRAGPESAPPEPAV